MGLDGMWDRDGARLQSWLARGPGIRRLARPGAVSTPELGLILKRHDKGASTNVAGNSAEYDVLLARHLKMISNVGVKTFKSSSDSGEEHILKPASEAPDIADPTTAMQNILASDGDLVIVEFVSGEWPIITGSMNHIRSGDTAPWAGEAAEGERRAWHHKDAHIVMREDGNLTIDLADNKGITFTINGAQAFRVYKDGTGLHIDLGSDTVAQRLILGDDFMSWINNITTGLMYHVHTITSSPALGPTSGPGQPPTGAVAIPTMTDTLLSDKAKTQK